MKAEAAVTTVRSADGTNIAFDRLGEGTPVILVSGASTSRAIHAQLAELLAGDFTVFNYDRRRRGDSGDTPPYTTEREVEDLHAVIIEAGGTAAVFGNSTGAVLALHAAAAGLPVTKLALWEPPFMVDPDAPRRQQEYVAQLTRLLDAGRRGDAMELFMRTGLPEEMIAGMRHAPMRSGMEAIAPTLAYDAAIMATALCPPIWSPRSKLRRSCSMAATLGHGQPTRRKRSRPHFPTRSAARSKDRPTTWPGRYLPPR
jgi:pimeloyl-ACP methyl ester carboxylesterase